MKKITKNELLEAAVLLKSVCSSLEYSCIGCPFSGIGCMLDGVNPACWNNKIKTEEVTLDE